MNGRTRTTQTTIRAPRKRADRAVAGIEYHGVPGSSLDCQAAVLRLLQCGTSLVHARIVSFENSHCLILTNAIGDMIAVKSGFSSGYGGTGPVCLSVVLQLLDSHGVEIDECTTDELLIERLDQSALTAADLEKITTAKAIRPSCWPEYILDRHKEQARDGTLWREFQPLVPFSVVDSRIIDLAREFWDDPDNILLRGYRRLEDLVRARTGLSESGAKLFTSAFMGKDHPILTWDVMDESERIGRANLFTGTYMAYRNPRAHHETPNSELLAEFLLLNQLYRLERSEVRPNRGGIPESGAF